MSIQKWSNERLSDSLVGGGAADARAKHQHDSVLAEAGEACPELVVGDALLDSLVLADKLEEDESGDEVDGNDDGQAAERGEKRVRVVGEKERNEGRWRKVPNAKVRQMHRKERSYG